MSLGDDLPSSLTDGVVLCHIANHVSPRAVSSIHVPSPAVVSNVELNPVQNFNLYAGLTLFEELSNQTCKDYSLSKHNQTSSVAAEALICKVQTERRQLSRCLQENRC